MGNINTYYYNGYVQWESGDSVPLTVRTYRVGGKHDDKRVDD